jgi:lipopolysaccharide export system protein LptC
MNFRQYEKDGSCDLNFSEEEIKIIVKNKKVHFTAEALRDFGNCLTKMVAHWNLNFNEELKNKITDDNSVIDLSNDQRTK